MSRRGQIVIVVAILLIVVLTLLAVAVDAGRLYVERARLARAAQAGADAGLVNVADEIGRLAATRQAEAAASPCPVCTPTPDPAKPERWLTEDDRSALIAPPMQTQVASVAQDYARRNGPAPGDPRPLMVEVRYPHGYNPSGPTVRLRVSVTRRVIILLAGLLGRDFVDLTGEAISEVRQR